MMTQKRIHCLLIMLAFFICASTCMAADLKTTLAKVHLQHKWQPVQCDADSCTYKSSYVPPLPFRAKNEAVMTVASVPIGQQNLDAVLKSEVAAIRSSLKVDDQLVERDGRRQIKGIAVWKERFDGKEIGFIRYRAYSEKAPPPHFFTAIHGVVLGANREYLVHLITFYAGHEVEFRADQISILKELAR